MVLATLTRRGRRLQVAPSGTAEHHFRGLLAADAPPRWTRLLF